jgi:hypothetical protein
MVGLVAAGFSRASCFRAAEVLSAREFVAAVIDHIVARGGRYDNRTQLVNLHLHKNCGHDQESFQDIGGDHDPKGNQAEWGFSGEPGLGTRKRGLDRAQELVPRRRPFHEQLGECTAGHDGFFEFESRAHAGSCL